MTALLDEIARRIVALEEQAAAHAALLARFVPAAARPAAIAAEAGA